MDRRKSLHRSICQTCKNASGTRLADVRCQWFHDGKPIEGWTARLVKLEKWNSYNVYECPMYVMEKEKVPYKNASEIDSDGAERLIEAITLQAINDLRMAYKAEENAGSYEKFLRSMQAHNDHLVNRKGPDVGYLRQQIKMLEQYFERDCNGFMEHGFASKFLKELKKERDRRRERTKCKLLD